jgi:hypothetical protein
MMILAKTPKARGLVAAYVAMRLGMPVADLVGVMPYGGAAVIRDDMMVGGIIFTNYREHTIEISLGGEPGFLTRSTIRAMFRHAFLELGVLCCCAIVRRDNNASRLLVSRLGGREAGVIEHAFGLRQDGILYTMTREACPWIEERRRGETIGKKPRSGGNGERPDRFQH